MSIPRAREAAAGVGVVLALVACAPEAGTVTAKEYSEGYEYPVTECRSVPRADGTVYQDCWTDYRWQEERFWLELEAVDAEGETAAGRRSVPEITYADCSVGDWYENGECS